MDEYGMNEFELIKKADVMRIINAENAAVLNNLKERSTDEVLCAISSQINGLQTTAKSGRRLIDATAFSEQYGNYYAEQGPEEGFIGTVGELIAQQPTIEAELVRHGRWIQSDALDYKNPNGVIHVHGMCSCCRMIFDFRDMTSRFKFCPNCGADMREEGADNG